MEQLIYQAQPIGLIDFIKSIWFYFFMLVIFLVVINFIQNNLKIKIEYSFLDKYNPIIIRIWKLNNK